LPLRVLWSRRLAEASVEAGAKTGRDAYRAHVERVQKLAKNTEALLNAGRGWSADVVAMRFHLAEAKLLLERAK
jgi:outer membrane protein TolC